MENLINSDYYNQACFYCQQKCQVIYLVKDKQIAVHLKCFKCNEIIEITYQYGSYSCIFTCDKYDIYLNDKNNKNNEDAEICIEGRILFKIKMEKILHQSKEKLLIKINQIISFI